MRLSGAANTPRRYGRTEPLAGFAERLCGAAGGEAVHDGRRGRVFDVAHDSVSFHECRPLHYNILSTPVWMLCYDYADFKGAM